MDITIALPAKNSVGESPFWHDEERALYWVDIIGKTANRLHLETGNHKQWSFDDFTCGIVPMENGHICVALQHDLLALNKDSGTVKKIFEIEPEKPKNRINEMKCDSNGRLWIGTMQNNVAPDGSGMDITENSGALYIVKGENSIKMIASDFGISNTLVWDDPEHSFYVADSMKDMMWKYDYNPDTCDISNPIDFFHQESKLGAPDGSAMDTEGCIWNARFSAGCVVRIGRNGEILEEIKLPITNPTSCCFGGENNSTLFITSAQFTLTPEQIKANPLEGSVIAIKTNVKGTPTYRWKLSNK